MHECQKDSLNSSKQARYLFLLSALPVFAVMYLLNELQHHENQIQSHFTYIGGLQIANICHSLIFFYPTLDTLMLDAFICKQSLMPFWLFKIKLGYVLLLNGLLVGLQVAIMKADNRQFQQPENVYKRALKTKKELL